MCARESDGKAVRVPNLMAYRCGDWCVTSYKLPVNAQQFLDDNADRGAVQLDGNPYSHPWRVTHAPSGLRASDREDLWRAILLCEELAKVFDGIDPTTDDGRNAERLKSACEAADARELAVIEAFNAYGSSPEEPVDA